MRKLFWKQVFSFTGLIALTVSACLGLDAAVSLDTSPDRVKTPLAVDMTRIGTLRPRSVGEIRGSSWTLGCETLDRDFADFEQYKRFLAPLGIKTIRLQAGWAKCEKEKGKYDFTWLDKIIDYACAQGINVLLETGYGNPIYKGGGGWDLAGGFPTSDEGIVAWDAWVDAMTKHFKGRVCDWAMWNEPDIGRNKMLKQIVAFNIRTARIIKRNIPDARIAGLSLAHNNPEYFEKCLKEMDGDVKMFDWFIYHGYEPAPESSYENVVSIFDDTLERVKDSRFGTRDTTLSTYEYKKEGGGRILVFWTHADETKSLKPKYVRPGDSFETRPAVFKYPNGQPFKEPVWIDLLTGRVYAFPKEKQIVVPAGVIFVDVPVYDSPCVLTERSAVESTR